MKKLFFIIAFIITKAVSSANAQQGSFKWNFGISGGIAKRQTFNEALGFDFGLETKINGIFSATAGIGFDHLFEHDFVNRNKYAYPYGTPYNTVPFQVGLKADIGNGFYIATKAGLALGTRNSDYGSSFVWTPSAGYTFKNGLDISLRYEDYTSFKGSQNFGLRVGYNIPFRRK
ncbi:hypothetical protein [Mucilaginibacter endophyticus]|uniref:hypothetical protein n=1 Tax=Mucilaginibacter endophyticus TaxID=2675003 RepID=UPI000E0CD33C|nr:hypothetical protein [Mucilaginibacter endophyticus]